MQAILRRELISDRVQCRIFGVLIFVIFTSLGAFIRINLPFTPVPITMQTFFVLLSGALLGSGLGMISQVSYIFLGMAGLPIFSGAGFGLIYLLGPTGGYLIGFVLASLWIGRVIKEGHNNFVVYFTIFCLADLIILGCGIIWLRLLLGFSFSKLLAIGLFPFIPADLIKVALATVFYSKLKGRFQMALK